MADAAKRTWNLTNLKHNQEELGYQQQELENTLKENKSYQAGAWLREINENPPCIPASMLTEIAPRIDMNEVYQWAHKFPHFF